MTSQPGQQAITIFLFKNYAENEAERLVPDLFFVFQKSFI